MCTVISWEQPETKAIEKKIFWKKANRNTQTHFLDSKDNDK